MKNKKATKIYLVRHGEVHNPENILYGRLPGYRLSETGKTQAHIMGKFLKDTPISAVYASPLQRTQETASILISYQKGLSIRADERLIEVGTPLQGTSGDALLKIRFDFYQEQYVKAGGETILDIHERMQKIITEIAEKHKGEHILAVSHGDPIMITRTFYRGEPLVLDSIRGDHYVPTAHGIEITIVDETVTVTDLHP